MNISNISLRSIDRDLLVFISILLKNVWLTCNEIPYIRLMMDNVSKKWCSIQSIFRLNSPIALLMAEYSKILMDLNHQPYQNMCFPFYIKCKILNRIDVWTIPLTVRIHGNDQFSKYQQNWKSNCSRLSRKNEFYRDQSY